jgi:dihydrofolate reductase
MNIIVAMTRKRVIGKNGKLPWNYPLDSFYFKEMVRGHICVYGRITYQDQPLEDLQERINVVEISMDKVLQVKEQYPSKEVFICGGTKVYEYFLPKCKYLYITWIEEDYEGDRYFPEFTGTLLFSISYPSLTFQLWKINQD